MTSRIEYRIMDKEMKCFFTDTFASLDGAKNWFKEHSKSETAFTIAQRKITYGDWEAYQPEPKDIYPDCFNWFINAIEEMKKGSNKTYYWILKEHNDMRWALVIGWAEEQIKDDKDFSSDGYHIDAKIAYQSTNAMTSCHYESDWLLPTDENGEVNDISVAITDDYSNAFNFLMTSFKTIEFA